MLKRWDVYKFVLISGPDSFEYVVVVSDKAQFPNRATSKHVCWSAIIVRITLPLDIVLLCILLFLGISDLIVYAH